MATKKNKKKSSKKVAKRPVRRTQSARATRRANARDKVTRRASRARVAAGTQSRASTKKSAATKPLPGGKITEGLASQKKYQQKVEGLIRLGRERGYVTYDEILREFPTIEDNVVLLEEMYERFSSAGIDVLE